jgi:threonine 3-dehydrogenase
MLSDHKNGIQDAIWNIMLNKGNGTIMPFPSYEKDSFERAMKEHPKIILSF